MRKGQLCISWSDRQRGPPWYRTIGLWWFNTNAYSNETAFHGREQISLNYPMWWPLIYVLPQDHIWPSQSMQGPVSRFHIRLNVFNWKVTWKPVCSMPHNTIQLLLSLIIISLPTGTESLRWWDSACCTHSVSGHPGWCLSDWWTLCIPRLRTENYCCKSHQEVSQNLILIVCQSWLWTDLGLPGVCVCLCVLTGIELWIY